MIVCVGRWGRNVSGRASAVAQARRETLYTIAKTALSGGVEEPSDPHVDDRPVGGEIGGDGAGKPRPFRGLDARGRLPPMVAGVDPRIPESESNPELDQRPIGVKPLLVPDVAILDVGAGRYPTLAAADRPSGCRYVGLDIESTELDAAAPGAYDEGVVADITKPLGRDGEFDLIVSWQVLEHVSPLKDALENLRAALRPGGTLLAQLTGSNAAFALGGRLVPPKARVWLATHVLGHQEEEKFPTRYDRSSHRTLERMLSDWSAVEIVPFYRGAPYFAFWRPAQRAYLAYESAIERRERANLATHYLVIAQR